MFNFGPLIGTFTQDGKEYEVEATWEEILFDTTIRPGGSYVSGMMQMIGHAKSDSPFTSTDCIWVVFKEYKLRMRLKEDGTMKNQGAPVYSELQDLTNLVKECG